MYQICKYFEKGQPHVMCATIACKKQLEYVLVLLI